MPYKDDNSKTDASGRLIPQQYYNDATDDFEVVKGSNGAPNVQLVGRKSAEKPFHNAVSIRDTANNDTVNTDVSDLSGRKVILIDNTLNQSVIISVIVRPNSEAFSYNAGSVTISASSTGIITPAAIPVLDDPWMKVQLRAVCSVAPTSGTLTTILSGVSV